MNQHRLVDWWAIMVVLLLGWTPRVCAQAAETPRSSQSPGLYYDFHVELPLTIAGGAFWVMSQLAQTQLEAKSCRWCEPDAYRHDNLNLIDRSIRHELRWQDTATANTLSNLTGFVGAPLLAFGLSVVAAYDAGHLRYALPDAMIILETAVLASDLNQIVKFAVGRERPLYRSFSGVAPPSGLVDADRYASFFSGHTNLVFALAVSAGTLASMRHDRLAPLIWAAGLTLAATTGYLRISADRHYFSDVMTGAAIGSLFGFLIPYVFHRRMDAGPLSHLSVASSQTDAGTHLFYLSARW